MTMAGLNWLILLAVSENLHDNFFNLKGLSDLPHLVMVTRTLQRKGPTLYLQFMGDLY